MGLSIHLHFNLDVSVNSINIIIWYADILFSFIVPLHNIGLSLVRQLSPENRAISYTFGHKSNFCMVVDIGQTRNSSRENPKFSAAILDFDRHIGFWHLRIKICLSWEPSSLKYHVIPLFIGFHGQQIQWWHYICDSMQLRRETSISALWNTQIHDPFCWIGRRTTKYVYLVN